MRNDTEAFHSELKKFGGKRVRRNLVAQEIIVITAAMAHNALSHVWHLKRTKEPNPLDGTA